MVYYHQKVGFPISKSNMGYGTERHQERIIEKGLTLLQAVQKFSDEQEAEQMVCFYWPLAGWGHLPVL